MEPDLDDRAWTIAIGAFQMLRQREANLRWAISFRPNLG